MPGHVGWVTGNPTGSPACLYFNNLELEGQEPCSASQEPGKLYVLGMHPSNLGGWHDARVRDETEVQRLRACPRATVTRAAWLPLQYLFSGCSSFLCPRAPQPQILTDRAQVEAHEARQLARPAGGLLPGVELVSLFTRRRLPAFRLILLS